MDWALAFTGFLMGLAGAPHCAAMCGPACAALLGKVESAAEVGAYSPSRGPDSAVLMFHGMRLAGYALAGALAAAGMGWLAWAGQTAPLVRPLWIMLHMAALALGLWLAITATQPRWMTRIGRQRASTRSGGEAKLALMPQPGGRLRQPGLWAAAAGGGFWVIWPCGLLQSAVVVAGLANSPGAGAGVMAAFALASALGLQALPALWRKWSERGALRPQASARLSRWAVRLAGALLAAGSFWALGHDLVRRAWAYCFG